MGAFPCAGAWSWSAWCRRTGRAVPGPLAALRVLSALLLTCHVPWTAPGATRAFLHPRGPPVRPLVTPGAGRVGHSQKVPAGHARRGPRPCAPALPDLGDTVGLSSTVRPRARGPSGHGRPRPSGHGHTLPARLRRTNNSPPPPVPWARTRPGTGDEVERPPPVRGRATPPPSANPPFGVAERGKMVAWRTTRPSRSGALPLPPRRTCAGSWQSAAVILAVRSSRAHGLGGRTATRRSTSRPRSGHCRLGEGRTGTVAVRSSATPGRSGPSSGGRGAVGVRPRPVAGASLCGVVGTRGEHGRVRGRSRAGRWGRGRRGSGAGRVVVGR